jgi:hypothetical protein
MYGKCCASSHLNYHKSKTQVHRAMVEPKTRFLLLAARLHSVFLHFYVKLRFNMFLNRTMMHELVACTSWYMIRCGILVLQITSQRLVYSGIQGKPDTTCSVLVKEGWQRQKLPSRKRLQPLVFALKLSARQSLLTSLPLLR